MIHGIFLDVGNTLRIVVPDEAFANQARQDLAKLIGATEPLDVLFERLTARWKMYRDWAKKTLIDVGEQELWTRYLLFDCPPAKIAPLAGELTRLWRAKDGRRVARPDAKPTMIELSRRGYTLGIIANTITENEIPNWLASDGLTDYFKTVVLSSQAHHRKPGPEMFWIATQQVGIAPANCAYVGDNPARDVAGARRAGMGMTIILRDPAEAAQEPPTPGLEPDVTIHALSELLNIFPALEKVE